MSMKIHFIFFLFVLSSLNVFCQNTPRLYINRKPTERKNVSLAVDNKRSGRESNEVLIQQEISQESSSGLGITRASSNTGVQNELKKRKIDSTIQSLNNAGKKLKDSQVLPSDLNNDSGISGDIDYTNQCSNETSGEVIPSNILSNLNNDSSIPYRIDTNNLVDATNNDNYKYWLQDQDIRDVAKIYMPYTRIQAINDDYEKNAIGCVVISLGNGNELTSQLEQFIDSFSSSSELSSRTFFINIDQSHWTTLVVAGRNGQYYGFYVDSLNKGILSIIKQVLENKKIDFVDLKTKEKQQSDGYNCGLWALQNARDINSILRDFDQQKNECSFQETTLKEQLSQLHDKIISTLEKIDRSFEDERRKLAGKLSKKDPSSRTSISNDSGISINLENESNIGLENPTREISKISRLSCTYNNSYNPPINDTSEIFTECIEQGNIENSASKRTKSLEKELTLQGIIDIARSKYGYEKVDSLNIINLEELGERLVKWKQGREPRPSYKVYY